MTSLADFLRLQSGVEAVRVDLHQREVSLATMAPVDAELLQLQLSAVLEAVENSPVATAVLAAGKLGGMKIEREGDSILFSKPTCPTAPKLWRWKKYYWPKEKSEESAAEWKMLAKQAAICGSALLLGWLWQSYGPQPVWPAYVAYCVALLAGGWDAAVDAWENIREGRLDVHFLMLSVALGAVAIGAWTEGALLLFLFSSSGAMEHYAEHRTHEEISALAKATPKSATIIGPDGHPSQRAVVLLEPGDIVEVRPDEIFPADGIVTQGQTAVDEANLTGESVPVEKSLGSAIYSGTLNQWGSVQVKLTKPARQSTVQNIMRLIHEARLQRSPSQRITDRFGTSYTLIVLGITAVAFFLWWLVGGLPPFHAVGETKSAFYRAMSLLVVASPCALVLSIPSAILAAMARAAKLGVLFRSGAAVEKLADVDRVAMDKTGTLTTGEMKMQAVESFPPGQEARILQLAVSMERLSKHPIARAIFSAGEAQGVAPLAVEAFVSLTGQGLRATVGGEKVLLGRRELIAQGNLAAWVESLPPEPLAATEVWILSEKCLGRILLVDKVREESREVIRKLKEAGLKTLMLTGDRRATAVEVASSLGVEEVRAGLTPEDKLRIITELTASGSRVAMVGDGVNDAPSLAAAHVSVAMGGRGSDAALEQADVALMNDRIEKFLTARTLSLHARNIIRQNLVLSLGTVLLMVSAALITAIPLTLGVVAHEGSTVLVCLNSLRLLFWKEK